MTGIWSMQAKTRDAKLVSLRFYTGPSAPPPNYVRLLGFIDNKKETRKSFQSQFAADEWAAKMGVRQWTVVHQSRAFPEAAKLPILFPQAPDFDQLHAWIESFESGTTLNDLAKGLVFKHDGIQVEVHPNLLRLWLIGAAPDHPALQRIKRFRRPED